MSKKFGLLFFCTLVTIAIGISFPSGIAEGREAQTGLSFDLGPPYIGGELPNGGKLIDPPPERDSLLMQIDRAANQHAISLQGSSRWSMAAQDADLSVGWYGRAFSCAAQIDISIDTTPNLANIIRRSATDFAMSTSGVKSEFQRLRPFMVNGKSTCTPDAEALLRQNGSYPSGHAAIGYGIGLLLASLLPDQGTALVSRGLDYGASRWVCNVHWYSDTIASRVFAAATLARLQTSPDFLKDLEAARAELSSVTRVASPGSCRDNRATFSSGRNSEVSSYE